MIFAFSLLIGIIPKVFFGLKRVKVPVIGLFLKIVGSFSQTAVVLLLAGILVLVNWNYFRPQDGKMGPLTEEEKFSGVAWELQQAAGAMDYLPIAAKKVPTEFKSSVAEVMLGNAEIFDSSSGSYWSLFKVRADEDTIVRINTFYFPEWRVFVKENSNSVEIPIYVPEEEEWGRMWIDLPAGEHLVYAQLFNTPVRTWSNLISLFSWLILIVILVRKKLNPGLFRRS